MFNLVMFLFFWFAVYITFGYIVGQFYVCWKKINDQGGMKEYLLNMEGGMKNA